MNKAFFGCEGGRGFSFFIFYFFFGGGGCAKNVAAMLLVFTGEGLKGSGLGFGFQDVWEA